MTMVLLLSAFAIVWLFRCRMFFIWFRLCQCLLCSVLCVLVVIIFFLIFWLLDTGSFLYLSVQVPDNVFCVYY